MLKDYNAKTLQWQSITMIAKHYNAERVQWQNITMEKYYNAKTLQC